MSAIESGVAFRCTRMAEDLDPAHALAVLARSCQRSSRSSRSRARGPAAAAGLRVRSACASSSSASSVERAEHARPARRAKSRLRHGAAHGHGARPLPGTRSRRSRAAFSSAARRIRQRGAILGGRRRFDAACRARARQLRGRTVSPKNRLAVSGSWCASSKMTVLQAGSSSADAFVAQHHVGEEQVVVDHHHVGFERLLARLHDEAVLVVRAVGAQAVLARRGGHAARPAASSGTSAQSARSPGRAGLGEALDARQVAHVLAALRSGRRRARARGGGGRRSWRGP